MLQGLMLYLTLGVTLVALGLGIDHWGFWCVIALFKAVEWLGRNEGEEQGLLSSTELLLELTQRLSAANEVIKAYKDELSNSKQTNTQEHDL